MKMRFGNQARGSGLPGLEVYNQQDKALILLVVDQGLKPVQAVEEGYLQSMAMAMGEAGGLD